MNESRKRNIIIASLCGVLLLMAVGYAAFQSVLNIEGTANITSNWDIKITNIEEKEHVGSATSATDPTHEDLTATFSVNLVSPGDSISYDVTIENQGSLDAELARIKVNKGNNPAIKFETDGVSEGDILQTEGSATLNVKITYDENVTGQPEDTSATFKVTLDYVQQGHKSEWSPNDTVNIGGQNVKVVTEGDGLYEDPNPEEAGRYVYAGANPDNYITFNEEVWRIVSVETDGTIKIMKNPTDATLTTQKAFDSQGKRDKTSNGAGGTYCAQGSYGCNVWAQTDGDYTSANGSYKGTVLLDSEMKTYLNGEYYNSITTNKDAIQEHEFYYGSPTWESTDLATQVTEEKSHSAMSNVGLIQASDYLKSNTNTTQCGTQSLVKRNYSTCKPTTWMVKNLSSKWYWTLSPNGSYTNYLLFVSDDGTLGNINVRNTSGSVAPALYLKSNIHLEGNGTQDEPYNINS